MTARPQRRLARRLFSAQLLVILAGAATLGVVAFLVAPPIFHDHVRRAVGPVSDVVAHHLDSALTETLVLALAIGVAASVAAAAAVSWLLASRIARPVEQLAETADLLAQGRLEARAPRPLVDDELAHLTAAFNGMAHSIETTETTRRRLLADLAHELRTPLATLEAYHEGLADGVVDPDADTAAVLADATSRLRRLVDDVSLVSRAEEGQLELDRRPTDLREVVASAIEAARPALVAPGLEVRSDPPADRVLADVDPDRIGQIVGNLLRNAVEHTPAGGTVTVRVAREGDVAVIVVSDTGVGIAAEHLEHVFERFYRADPARGRAAGSGIGLTISRAIAVAHGGSLTGHSDGRDRGASFVLTLPASDGGFPAGGTGPAPTSDH